MKTRKLLQTHKVSDYGSGALSTSITTMLRWRNNKRPGRQNMRTQSTVGVNRARGQPDNESNGNGNVDLGEAGAAEEECKIYVRGPYVVVGGIMVVLISTVPITGLVGMIIIFMGMRVTYARVRRSGLLPYFSPSMRRLLTQTSLVDVIANREGTTSEGGLLDYIPSYMMLSLLGTSEQEIRSIAFRLPSPVRRAFFRPGVLHVLPPQLQAVILPQSASLPPSLQCRSPVRQGQERLELVETAGMAEGGSPVSQQQQQPYTFSATYVEPAVTPSELVWEIMWKRVKTAACLIVKQHALPCALVTGLGLAVSSSAQRRALMAGLTTATLFVSSMKTGIGIDMPHLLIRARGVLLSTRAGQIFRLCLFLLVLKVARSINWRGHQRPRLASNLHIWGKALVL